MRGEDIDLSYAVGDVSYSIWQDEMIASRPGAGYFYDCPHACRLSH